MINIIEANLLFQIKEIITHDFSNNYIHVILLRGEKNNFNHLAFLLPS